MDNYEKIKRICEIKKDFSCCRVHSLDGNLLMYIEGKSPEDMRQKLFEYLTIETPQIFKIWFKVSKNTTEYHKHEFNFIPEDVEIVNSSPAPTVSPDEIELRITQGINAKISEMEFNRERKEFEEKKKEIDTIAGKFAIVLEHAIPKILNAFTQPQAITQGVPMTVQNETVEDMINKPSQDEKMQIANELLIKHLGIDNIYKLATKIENDPSLLNYIKPFLA